jgi:cytochrome c-type biogenesis protein
VVSATVTASPLGVLVAFGAGVISFLSPCVLPLVPGYVSMISGLSVGELSQPGAPKVGAGRLSRDIGLFVAGFTVVFVALGAAASGLGHLLGSHRAELNLAAGAVIVALGAVVLVGSMPSRVWALLPSSWRSIGAHVLAERRIGSGSGRFPTYAAPVMGMAFGFAWTPCIGPVLGAVTALAASRSTLGGGVLLLFAYALGLGVPFLATGLALRRLAPLYARARRVGQAVQLVAGVILVAFGILLLTAHFGWLAGEMGQLMRHIGLGRLAVS